MLEISIAEYSEYIFFTLELLEENYASYKISIRNSLRKQTK